MDGKPDVNKILDELFEYAQFIIKTKRYFPYVALVTKNQTILSRGYNMSYETQEITDFGDVVAIRSAQEALETGDLTGYALYSFFEPTILGFDVALWSGIRDFVWCIHSSSYQDKYNKMSYTPLDYLKAHPGEITVNAGLREQEALEITKSAKNLELYPNTLI